VWKSTGKARKLVNKALTALRINLPFSRELPHWPMFTKYKTDSKRRLIIAGASALLALAACSDSDTKPTTTAVSGASYEIANDHAIGNPDAKVTVVEYASVTCGHCANFHESVYYDFKKKYIDSGLVRFVFREFPTQPANIAKAGFLIANCAPEERRQQQIVSDPRGELIKIARSAGLSEEEFEACIQNPEEIEKFEAKVQHAIDAGVSGTPSFEINGETVKRTPSGKPLYKLETWDEVLAPLLGDDAPAPEKAEDAAESSSE